jgi:hypothetical protein
LGVFERGVRAVVIDVVVVKETGGELLLVRIRDLLSGELLEHKPVLLFHLLFELVELDHL